MDYRVVRLALTTGCLGLALASCILDTAPDGPGRTPAGPGARVRYDLGHKPLPDIPLPIDTATWPDPTSRTGLRINASLVAPTSIEREARRRFSQVEGWGTFAPITVSFDVDGSDPAYADYEGPALDLANIRARHQGDDYDFADDAVYLIDLTTGVPQVLDIGAGNFSPILRELDKYWANDTRRSERNLLFESIDETAAGAIQSYAPEHDTDFDGVLDQPNFDVAGACPDPDPVCDDPDVGADYHSDECVATRRERDQCIADHLLTWYERETDTFIVRPLLPLDEMKRYAVVLTDRLIDGAGNPVKSPFEFVYHATQRPSAQRVLEIIDSPELANYFGDIHGTGLDHVAFLWSFTTQPTVDDMVRLRDGLYGQGPFARWAAEYPIRLELQRAVGLTADLAEGLTDQPGWQTSPLGQKAGCPVKAKNLFMVRFDDLKPELDLVMEFGFGAAAGPELQTMLRRFDAIDHMVIANYQVPFILEGGPDCTDSNASANLNFVTGNGEVSTDTVQAWFVIPKQTAKHRQPFDVNVYAHGYTGNFVEMLFYAGNLAEHGLATVGINAMGHGLSFEDQSALAKALLAGICYAPTFNALTATRARDLNEDTLPDSGGDFWSSYLFHTRDSVRQSLLDHLQLVRILRSFGHAGTWMTCRNDGDKSNPVKPCDFAGDGSPELLGDFDGNGVPDMAGPTAIVGTWGESLGGILSAMHGAIDPYVSVAVPTSGGGGLSDIGIRSFQGGVVEAVLLRIWGPLVVGLPAASRETCTPTARPDAPCTVCSETQVSVRWVLPDVNGTGEVEIACLETGTIDDTTVRVRNLDNDEVRCARVDEQQRFRVGIPASTGDQIMISFWDGRDSVLSYDGCLLRGGGDPRHVIERWGRGRFAEGTINDAESASCQHATCSGFQGAFFGEGTILIAPGDGFGHIRQTPALRRFLSLAQTALEPGDPISFAPYYALKPLQDPYGHVVGPRAMLTINTIGDMNVPLNTGIAFARAAGALPFLLPDSASRYPHYADYATPPELFEALGSRTPNQELIDRHVIEGIRTLARHPAEEACADSANAAPPGATFLDADGEVKACYPTGCTEETEASEETRVCFAGTHCEIPDGAEQGTCVANTLGRRRCEEALWDPEDLDEGQQLYFEGHADVPQRLARLASRATASTLSQVWAPRLDGAPFSSDAAAYNPRPTPAGRLLALLNAYIVLEGQHCFENGNPCQNFDTATYLTNLVARFFQTDGTDLYYLSHPTSHHCLATEHVSCDYTTAP